MMLFVGLGNPDDKYKFNRHNAGFQFIDKISDHFNFNPPREKFQSLLSEGLIEGHGVREKVLLLKPRTYYNESGRAVQAAVQFYKLTLSDIVVFHDELDLAPGKVKVKAGGGAAGNNGLKSISSHLGPDFMRVRIGIGHPGDKAKVTSYVLSDFTKSEMTDWVEDLQSSVARAAPLLTVPETGMAKFLSAVALDQKNSSAQEKTPTASIPKAAPTATSHKKTKEAAPQPTSPFDQLKKLIHKDT